VPSGRVTYCLRPRARNRRAKMARPPG
jgi:hypothetical protein